MRHTKRLDSKHCTGRTRIKGIGADLRKQVVDDVGLDDAVEEISADEAKVAVDGGEGALDVGPVVGVKVGELGVGVVEVGNGNYRARASGK